MHEAAPRRGLTGWTGSLAAGARWPFSRILWTGDVEPAHVGAGPETVDCHVCIGELRVATDTLLERERALGRCVPGVGR